MKGKAEIPQAARLTAIAFTALIAIALARPVITNARMPLFWPLLVAVLSAAILYIVRSRTDATEQFMRAGFYVGMFAFFLSFPILSPEDINPDIPNSIHSLLGWALLATVAGFEVMYWVRVGSKASRQSSASSAEISDLQRRWLFALVFLGIAAWFLSVWDYASAVEAPITSVILTMRGVIEGTQEDMVSGRGYLGLVLGAGVFLAASGASLLLTACRLPIMSAMFCWFTVLGCAGVGFLSGSRAIFLYSVVPLAVAVWRVLSKLPFKTVFRFAGVASAMALVLVIWGAMTAMRGADIRNYEGGIEEISPLEQAQGALDIYSMTAVVVETFPQRIPYAYGDSALPLVLGWVPRTLWADKPYPFSLYMNILNGESVQVRSTSFAVGLTGEGYGNFGLFGAFLWGGFLGFACRRGDRYIGRFHPDNPLRLQLAGMAAVWVAMIVRGGVPEMFYMGLQVIILPWALGKFLSYSRRAIVRRAIPQRILTAQGRS